eukprot:scaffold5359_cov265-Pinguiococcus_pyrenoidosus.AAC.3
MLLLNRRDGAPVPHLVAVPFDGQHRMRLREQLKSAASLVFHNGANGHRVHPPSAAGLLQPPRMVVLGRSHRRGSHHQETVAQAKLRLLPLAQVHRSSKAAQRGLWDGTIDQG